MLMHDCIPDNRMNLLYSRTELCATIYLACNQSSNVMPFVPNDQARIFLPPSWLSRCTLLLKGVQRQFCKQCLVSVQFESRSSKSSIGQHQCKLQLFFFPQVWMVGFQMHFMISTSELSQTPPLNDQQIQSWDAPVWAAMPIFC